jgi:hypothetical protein
MNLIIGNMYQIPNAGTLMQPKGICGHGKKANKLILNLANII